MFPTLPAALAHHAATIPEQRFTRILKGGQVLADESFAGMWQRAAAWAGLFASLGLGRGDRAVLALPNNQHFVGAYYGCLIAGLAPAPVAPLRRVEDTDPYLRSVIARAIQINARTLVVPAEQARIGGYTALQDIAVVSEASLAGLRPLTDIRSTPADPALIQFTSGTAGEPKAVVLSQAALVAQVRLLRDWLKLEDRLVEHGVSWLPLFHDMGLIGFLLTPGYAGGEVNLMQPEDFILRPSLWLKALSDYRATVTGGPPSAYALLTKRVKDADAAGYNLSYLRAALIGAEMVTRDCVSAFCEKFAAAGFQAGALLPTYGLAENCLAVSMPPLGTPPRFDAILASGLAGAIAQPAPAGADPAAVRHIASVGVPLPGTTLRILDRSGAELPERRIGEIVLQSPCRMDGYLGQARQEGWLSTGDLGYLADGCLYVTGRTKEVIIVGGRNYYPDDIEQVIVRLPGVRQDRAVAIGLEDRLRATERLVVLAETDRAQPDERSGLRLAIRQALLDAGYPVGDVALLKPKTIRSTLTGKLKRLDCKERFLAGEFQETLA